MNPKEIYLSKPWLKYYPQGVPAEVEVPEASVNDLFRTGGGKIRKQGCPDLLREKNLLPGA